ncbi:hypothetical protein R6Q59_005235 [Mikania micrantha]|uniref:BHLH domain-containing protein n=1 Tax=Mikania micrantha TaxID=192012 RepID=A0A5N6Q353_9ASTR|nr:hypothetical protein E3N88_02118 [Mikania micrantha]
MEQSFQSLLLAGKYSADDGNFLPFSISDDTHIHSQMSYQKLNYEKSLLSSLIYPYYPSISYDNAVNVNLQSEKISERFNEHSNWRCAEREEKLKRMKTEPSNESSFNLTPAAVFCQMPELRSIEQANQQEKQLKQKFSTVAITSNQQMLEPTVTSFQLATSYLTPATFQPQRLPIAPPAKLSKREQGTRRQYTLSDKTRSLQKLLPVEGKMDMATIYEETFKYIKFLKAQISVLESMSVTSTSGFNFRSENPRYGNLYEGLGKLNRQQLLEVLVNSPAAQSVLYSKACCIYSLEQLMLLNDIAGKNFFSGH